MRYVVPTVCFAPRKVLWRRKLRCVTVLACSFVSQNVFVGAFGTALAPNVMHCTRHVMRLVLPIVLLSAAVRGTKLLCTANHSVATQLERRNAVGTSFRNAKANR